MSFVHRNSVRNSQSGDGLEIVMRGKAKEDVLTLRTRPGGLLSSLHLYVFRHQVLYRQSIGSAMG
ncbi:hypothetical protein BRAO285_610005 [Bradyrhizobium sp. ORS 285]|nr:hypothetical protein BRAO285_610005 [Bradyrhizobium sp. ORS 285]